MQILITLTQHLTCISVVYAVCLLCFLKIDVLSEVVSAVQDRTEVYLDGGVRQGTDVLKALAMGARAVFIGRPVIWGLACNGQQGVEAVLEMLRDEFKTAMVLSGKYFHIITFTIIISTGCRNVAEIKQDLIKRE